MLKLNHYLLAAASFALVGFAAAPANAGTCNGDPNCSLGTAPYVFGANDVFGGGSTLISPYFRQMSDCYNGYADLIQKGTAPNNETFVDEELFNYTGTGGPQNCGTTQIAPGTTTWSNASGSGNGLASLFSHDPVAFFGDANENGPQVFPHVHYADSDAGLSGPKTLAGTELFCYYNGSCSEKGASIGAPGTPCNSTSPYPVPAECWGTEIQYPISVDPVVIGFPSGGVYEKIAGPGQKEISYKFRTSTIKFSHDTLCKIYNGQITNWNDPAITADNGGTSLESASDPTPAGSWSVKLFPVGRSDSSGTTSIFTRHLAATCGGIGGNQYLNGSTSLPAGLQGNTYAGGDNENPNIDIAGKITLAPGNSGVATYVAFVDDPAAEPNNCTAGTVLPANYNKCIQQARVGYMGADFALPYVKNSRTNSYNLYAAELQNHAGNYVKASPAAALNAFAGISPPQSDSKGNFCASCGGDRTDQSQWAESTDLSQPLADPTQTAAYPMVGTTNFDLYQCYANAAQKNVLLGQLNYIDGAAINTDKKNGVLALAGLAPLPAQWLKAIKTTFLADTDGLHLNIQAVNGGSPNCSTSVHTALVGG